MITWNSQTIAKKTIRWCDIEFRRISIEYGDSIELCDCVSRISHCHLKLTQKQLHCIFAKCFGCNLVNSHRISIAKNDFCFCLCMHYTNCRTFQARDINDLWPVVEPICWRQHEKVLCQTKKLNNIRRDRQISCVFK